MLSPFLNAIFHRGTFPPGVANNLLDKLNAWFLKESPLNAMLKLPIVLIIVFSLKGVVGYFQKYLGALVEESVMKKVRNDLYRHLHSLSLGYFYDTKAGELSSRITNDVAQLKDGIKEGMLKFVQELLVVVTVFALAFYISWNLLLVTMVTFPLLTYLVTKLGKRLREKSDRVQDKMGDIMTTFGESISGIKIIKAFNMDRVRIKKFFQNTLKYYKASLSFERTSNLGVPLTEFVNTLGACIVLIYGAYLIFVARSLPPDRFILFLGCVIYMMNPLKEISKANIYMQRSFQAMERVARIFEKKPAVVEASDAIFINEFKDKIEFKNVSFSYGDSKNAISGINLTIRKGETVALVGPSGAGKSTLADILLRFYDPSSGSIEIDGIDLRKIKIESLRSLIGLVTQEIILFNDTVFNNIVYSKEDVKLKDVERAAKLANAHEFIMETPHGYNTVIGERGMKLSGGERQRIAIARALFKNPQLLIFDEATSSLDTESERLVNEAIDRLLHGRTSIIIAHRLSTIKNSKRIIVLDKGKIVEDGTHKELLTHRGLYRRLVEKELS